MSTRPIPAAEVGARPRWRLWRPALGVLVMSGLLTVFSEVFYWYSGGTDYPARVVFYLIPTTALLWTMARFPRFGWPAVVLLGAVYGFVTEGVLTSIVYGSFPFDPFSISYTALAWHAPLAVGFGLVLLHRLLARGSSALTVGAAALFGAFWGIWAVPLRVPFADDEEVAGLAVLVGGVGVGAFACYTVAATAVVAAGHLVLGHVVGPEDLQVRRPWTLIVLATGVLWLALLVVPAAWWAPVELPVLLGLCLFALRRWQRQPGVPATTEGSVLEVVTERIRPRRLVFLAALPAAAVATYAFGTGLAPSEDALRTLQTGVVVTQTVVGWVLFVCALGAASRGAHRSSRRQITPAAA